MPNAADKPEPAAAINGAQHGAQTATRPTAAAIAPNPRFIFPLCFSILPPV